jgi:hypothetical protein
MQIVPQYIDVEDKIAGPLTWKHIGWFFGGGIILSLAWIFLDHTAFYFFAVPTGIMTAALAFYKPNGVSMIQFIGYGLGYLFRSKLYTWQNEGLHELKNHNSQVQKAVNNKEGKLSVDDIAAIAHTLDSHGRERNDRIKQLIKERTQNKK